MKYELIKNELIKLKKEELNYIDSVAKISSTKTLSEYEKLEIHRNLNNYQNKLTEMFKNLFEELVKCKELSPKNYRDVIIEFDIDKKFLSSIKFDYERQKEYTLNGLGIDEKTFKFKVTLKELLYLRERYSGIDSYIIQNKQRLIETPIYVFCGKFDDSEYCVGPSFGESYYYGIYENIFNNSYNNDRKEIPEKEMDEFEKDKIIIHSKRYVYASEVSRIFEEELLNSKNKTIKECVNKTKNRIEELSYIRSPEYKEKVLLDRINQLYKNIKGEFIKEEILYSDEVLNVLRETFKLQNETIIQKEKVVNNNKKNSVIIIPITQDKEYIITFQNKTKDKAVAEFPKGYIENDEDIIQSAKSILKEKTGYITDDLFIVDDAYIYDESVGYIVVANNCIKQDEKNIINYDLFTEKELEYLINKNIMSDVINKLAYYSFVNNTDDCNVVYIKSNKHIYKKKKDKTNPLSS